MLGISLVNQASVGKSVKYVLLICSAHLVTMSGVLISVLRIRQLPKEGQSVRSRITFCTKVLRKYVQCIGMVVRSLSRRGGHKYVRLICNEQTQIIRAAIVLSPCKYARLIGGFLCQPDQLRICCQKSTSLSYLTCSSWEFNYYRQLKLREMARKLNGRER
jgi:hypothetical protein